MARRRTARKEKILFDYGGNMSTEALISELREASGSVENLVLKFLMDMAADRLEELSNGTTN
jgi:hypothetical protein